MAVDKNVSLKLQHAAELVIEAGPHAGKLMDKTVGRGERSREYFKRLAELLDLYISTENLVDGIPQYPLSAPVAKQLASLCHYLGDGIIPGPIKHCARRGRPLGPDERRDVRYSVAYVFAAKDGLIQDPHPIKTITEEYGLSDRKAVQGWIRVHGSEIAKAGSADPELIKARMMEAAGRYRESGRHHGAIRSRASKNPAVGRREPK
jgi:hypothetical protein